MKKTTDFLVTIIVIAIILCSITFTVYMLTKDNHKSNSKKEQTKSGIVKEEDSKSTDKTSLSYSNIVSIDLAKEKVELYLKNPGKSNKNIKLYVYAFINNQEVLIAQSNKVKNGYTIYSLDLLDKTLTNRKYKGYFKVKYYDLNNEQEEIVDTKIDIQINVK